MKSHVWIGGSVLVMIMADDITLSAPTSPRRSKADSADAAREWKFQATPTEQKATGPGTIVHR